MKVGEIMTRGVEIASPDDTVQQAASRMAELDVGVLPVGENDRLVGMLTDRDIAIRAVAQGRGPDTKVREAMTPEVRYCFEDEDTAHVALNMGQEQIRRLPVVDRNKRLVGILSLADLATSAKTGQATAALSGISQAGGSHSQSA